ncbi:MAG TPA: 2-oxoacid:acceptor oxidoreductase family protein [Mycobacterium sp.]|nr:2-oxoacid:acceptor oxidoreductase family protein [Mycobacterium sp.]HWT47347.1 2-oxoacid:acceptor oxidoreductase family protein [Mycobacterium sp.]
MQREVVLTGIGGQGVQFASQVLARGALAAGFEVQLFGSYGGMMRGGNTEATLVVSDEPVLAPPTVDRTWSAMVMHHDYWEHTRDLLSPETYVLVDSSVFEGTLPSSLLRVTRIPATRLAIELGKMQTACMVLLGALLAVTELIPLQAVIDAVPAALPPYRQAAVKFNQRALQVGHDAARRDMAELPLAAET